MIRLTKEQILLMQGQLIERYGGSHGIRDEGMLDSALSAPFQGYADVEFYPTVLDKAVRLSYGLIMNHPFIDGNKRIGALSLLVILDLNHIELDLTSKELEETILSVASGKLSEKEYLKWVQAHIA